MKNNIKKQLHKLFYKIGYHPPRKFPKPEDLYRKLKYEPLLIQSHELRILSSYIRQIEDHEYYNSLIKTFIPQWNIKAIESKFIARGRGESSLNLFRKITVKDQVLFEKIYLTDHHDYKVNLIIHNYCKDILRKNGVIIPEIKMKYEGPILSAIYFEFIDANTIENQAKMNSTLINISKNIQECTTDIEMTLSQDQNDILSTSNNNAYLRRYAKEKKMQSADIEVLKRKILNSKRSFSHGDLHRRNLLKQNIVIDWDEAGFYPIGFEPARIYAHRLAKDYVSSDYE